MNRFLSLLVALSLLSLSPQLARSSNPHATLADLKKLEILCYIPGWLPKGFKLKSVTITYDEPGPDEGSGGRFPLYQYEYAGPTRGGVETASPSIAPAKESATATSWKPRTAKRPPSPPRSARCI